MNTDHQLPDLVGSPKQIGWAERLRKEAVPKMIRLAGSAGELDYAWTLFKQATSARWWIESRFSSPEIMALDLHKSLSSTKPKDDQPDDIRWHPADPESLAEGPRNLIRAHPTLCFSDDVLISRIRAGLAPGDSMTKRRKRTTYLGGFEIRSEALGAFMFPLTSRTYPATEEQLGALLAYIAQSEAIEAMAETATPQSPAGQQGASPARRLLGVLILADATREGEFLPAESDIVVNPAAGFPGGKVVELRRPFFGSAGDEKDLLLQRAYIEEGHE